MDEVLIFIGLDGDGILEIEKLGLERGNFINFIWIFLLLGP
jgi:hypothetical protein